MQIQAINTNKNFGFGTIYRPKDVNFNESQESIADKIKAAMREPLPKFNGNTAEAFYKSKGLDFEIEPHTKESVYLNAYTNMKEIGTGKDRSFTYSDFVNIGEYDKDSDFRVSDIETSLKIKLYNGAYLLAIFLAAVLAMCTIAFGRIKFTKHSPEGKPFTEFVDSIANKTQSIQKDIVKVQKAIINH